MCNCGNKRNGFTVPSSATSSNAVPIKQPAEKMWPDIKFMYTGQSALSVTGSVTGKRYRFNRPGEQQLIDFRDAAAMITVPVLKRMV
jgi:hypothetical protein